MQPSASCNLWILHTHSDQSLVSVCPSYITDMFTVLLCLVGHWPGCEVASHCQLTVTRELAEQAEYSLSRADGGKLWDGLLCSQTHTTGWSIFKSAVGQLAVDLSRSRVHLASCPLC